MNKIEYLRALKEALKDTNQSVMEEIVSDYEEHFQVGIEKGKSEEQICEDLGSIDDLVEEIKEVYNAKSKEAKKTDDKKAEDKEAEEKKEEDKQSDSKNKKFGPIIISIDGKKIGNVINDALDTAGEAISNIDVVEIGNNLKNTLGQAASSLNNFADSYLKNQGADPFDYNRKNAEGYTENVSKSYDDSVNPEEEKTIIGSESETQADTEDKSGTPDTVSSEESSEKPEDTRTESNSEKPEDTEAENENVTSEKNSKGLNLAIDGICADINVYKSTNGKINISYVNNGNERQKQIYEFYSYKEGNTVYAGVRRVGKAVFLFNLKTNSININVELPEYMDNVNIKTASGDIIIADVKSDRIVAEAASGDVSINRVYTTDCRIKCSSGDIRINDINSIQISASTMSGDVEACNIEAKNLLLKSFSGNLKAKNLIADIIDSSSLSGDLDMDNMKASECKIRSTSGAINIHEFTMNNADVSSVSGDIKLSDIVGDGLRSCSTSGNVTLGVNVKRCHASSKSGNVDVKCDGDVILESNSISGSIKVHLKNYGNGYSVKSRTTSGELYINYNDIHQRNLKTGMYTYGNQGSELTLGTISGDIHLND